MSTEVEKAVIEAVKNAVSSSATESLIEFEYIVLKASCLVDYEEKRVKDVVWHIQNPDGTDTELGPDRHLAAILGAFAKQGFQVAASGGTLGTGSMVQFGPARLFLGRPVRRERPEKVKPVSFQTIGGESLPFETGEEDGSED